MQEVEVAVIETREEWDALVAAELARLGLTYEELAEQARTEDFSSDSARWIWMVVGDRH
jgi:hypothetical protein